MRAIQEPTTHYTMCRLGATVANPKPPGFNGAWHSQFLGKDLLQTQCNYHQVGITGANMCRFPLVEGGQLRFLSACRIWMFYDSDILPMNKSVVPFGMFKCEVSTCHEQRTISYQSWAIFGPKLHSDTSLLQAAHCTAVCQFSLTFSKTSGDGCLKAWHA